MNHTKYAMYLNLCVATFQICAIVLSGGWPFIFMFAVNYGCFWMKYRQYKREKAKEWYASILAAQRRAQFPQRMKGCIGWCCTSLDDYVQFNGNLIHRACKLCGLFE